MKRPQRLPCLAWRNACDPRTADSRLEARLLPYRPTGVLAQATNLALATAPLAAAAGKARQDISAAPNHSRQHLPAGPTAIEGLGGFGQGQPLAGAHSFVQFALQVVGIGFCIREEVPCEAKETLGLRTATSECRLQSDQDQGCCSKFHFLQFVTSFSTKPEFPVTDFMLFFI